VFPARVPNPFDDDAQREQRVDAQLPIGSRRAALIVGGGCAALIGFFAAWLAGYPGVGAVLVPIGLVMVLLGGIELFLGRLA
jgi:hypothetical protein